MKKEEEQKPELKKFYVTTMATCVVEALEWEEALKKAAEGEFIPNKVTGLEGWDFEPDDPETFEVALAEISSLRGPAVSGVPQGPLYCRGSDPGDKILAGILGSLLRLRLEFLQLSDPLQRPTPPPILG